MHDSNTVVLPSVPEPAPVFVDSTGRRRRRLRRLAYGLGALGLVYTAMVGVSLAGGPVSPRTVLPFIDLTDRSEPITPLLTPGPAEASEDIIASPTPMTSRVGSPSRPGPAPAPTKSNPPRTPQPVAPATTAPQTPAQPTSSPASPTTTPPTSNPPTPTEPPEPPLPAEHGI